MMQTTRVTIDGYIVGPIWWPAGAECFKPLHYDVTREDARVIDGDGATGADFRWHIVQASNDGDFQHSAIADGAVTIEREGERNGIRVKRSRSFPLDMFPSIADCVLTDWAGPSCDWED